MNQNDLKKELHKLKIKTYKKRNVEGSYVKKSEIEKALKTAANMSQVFIVVDDNHNSLEMAFPSSKEAKKYAEFMNEGGRKSFSYVAVEYLEKWEDDEEA